MQLRKILSTVVIAIAVNTSPLHAQIGRGQIVESIAK
jgi:hypothetical protein